MKQKKKFIFFLISLFLLVSSCNEFKRTLTNTKKSAGDEFLVEKKEPLTVPPNFDKLPVPLSEEEEIVEENTENNIEDLLKRTSKTENENLENLSGDLEDSILEKINNAN
tara:strand:+ start:1585 stop:1914 length:330 start_codon:yes stop_codon:yes gene_type:complete